MKTSLLAGLVQCVVLPGLLLSFARAEDLTTRSGRALRDIQITELHNDSVVVKHSGGSDRIPLNDLPAAWQKRLSAPVLFDELKRKEQELEALRNELGRARGETQTLRKETQSLKQEKQDLTAAASKAGVTLPPRKPVAPLASLPPLSSDSAVAAEDLAAQFRADPEGAAQRYKGQTFRVRGTVDRFNLRMFVRNYDVVLETGDHTTRVVCNLPYEDEYKAVYPKEGGQTLVGNSPRRGEVTLMKAGADVTIKGRCGGLKDNQVVFSDCTLAK